ncbi:aminotransferase class V-fold PLP-dependent enzyme [Frigidibacter sp. RF13]|uniref:cysteine desulfurase family protein n=1 Tax=Frigidibacter sp. RF13 TaxID=2997340 RepID=UPI002272296F|nr:aminotransferase class V-fold PLP-dependent enzyme [Frigidibacter sp. RF13]MCY1125493.1 aminotransferase class V-fold PLP-dependent enzyme [Frigidibacter sp. RF13]
MSGRVYLDWNATAPLRPEARDAMGAAMDVAGNASSVHAEGRAAKMLIERSREEIAAVVGCKPVEVYFTSGATEAAGVLAGFEAVEVEPTAHDCLIAHAKGEGGILAMGLANSETGAIAPVPERAGLLLDVVQAVGRMPFAFGWSGADFAIISAHKLGGPKGVGALIVREGLDFETLRPGGGQEKGRRSGTENVMGIAGFAAAAKAAERDLEAGVWDRVRALRDGLEARLLDGAPGSVIAGADAERLPNTTLIVTPGWKGETQVMQMDLAGFAVSAGSACSSGKVRLSRVLTAMGFDDLAAASGLRISLGPVTREADVTRFADAWLQAQARFRARAA